MPAGLAGTLIGPSVTIAKDSYKAAKPQYDYVIDIDENFEKLRSATTGLSELESDVKDELKKNSNEMIMTGQCRLWFDRVGKTNESFTELRVKYQKTNRRLFGLWPFLKLRELGKDIVDLTKEITTRREEMTNLKLMNNVMVTREPQRVELKHSIDVLELDSQTDSVKQLLDHLRDVTVKKIGLYGLEGIGKTTIMEKLHKKVMKKPELGVTFFISVPSEDSSRKVQEDLLRQLGLPIIGTQSSEQVADIISKKIENVKYVLLLDQVSSTISLDAIGIRDYHNHGKVVIASNKRQICKDMGADEFLKVEQMPLEDAHKLFNAIVGDVTIRQRIETVAKQIVKNLIRLPRAIILVATTLKKERKENKWDEMLQALTDPIIYKQHHLEDLNKMFTNLFNQLLFTSRRCLFYASLFPSEYKIHEDYLVECWINEGFISHDNSFNQPFRSCRVYGLTTLDDLIEASLLEKCRSRLKYIIMPEQIRKLSLQAIGQVEESEPLVLTKQKEAKEDWKHAKRISLMCNNFCILPQSPTNCSKTRTLLLQKNLQLEHISKSFFAHMCDIQVLDLYASSVKSLPQSLFDLTSLQSLYLNHCKQLTSLSSKIEKLENLKLLDLRDTGIRTLPKAIGKLGELKCFRVSLLDNGAEGSSKNLIKNLIKRKEVLIPKKMIKKLRKLEELTIIIDPNERSWNEIAGQIIEEIASLEVLTTLYFNFPGVDSLVAFVKTSKSWKLETDKWGSNTFRSYKMLVGTGGVNERHNLDHSERLLRFCSRKDFPSEIKVVLQQASAFELIGHDNVRSLAEFGVENLRCLEVCVIEKCDRMESVIDSNYGIVFPTLERLLISKLPKLDCVWKGEMVEGSLVNLTTLILKECPKLTMVLTSEAAHQLKQLKRLRVENCSGVVLIIGSIINSHFLAEDNKDNPLMVTTMLRARSCIMASSSGAKVNSQPLISNVAAKINETENPSEELEKFEAEDKKLLAENSSNVRDIKCSRSPENIGVLGKKILAQNRPRVGEIVDAENHSGTSKISEARNNSRVSEIIEFEHEIVTHDQSMNGKTVKVETHSRINEKIEARNHSRVNKIIEARNHFKGSEIVKKETNLHRVEIENIAGTVRIENLAGALPKLESLELVDLPLLSAICQSDALSFLALENIEIQKCPNFRKLSSITMKSEELCSIKCTNSFWEAQVWPQNHLRQQLQLLCRFIQEESPNDPSSSSGVVCSPTSWCTL